MENGLQVITLTIPSGQTDSNTVHFAGRVPLMALSPPDLGGIASVQFRGLIEGETVPQSVYNESGSLYSFVCAAGAYTSLDPSRLHGLRSAYIRSNVAAGVELVFKVVIGPRS